MFPFPTLTDDDDDIDPRMRERLVLGRGRWHLAQVVAFECTPRRILRLGRPGFDLAGLFPTAEIVHDPQRMATADVVWCDFALASLPEPARAISRLWEGMADNALLAVVDAHRVSSDRIARWLGQELGICAAPGLLAGLRIPFSPLHVSILDHQRGAWQSVGMVGRKR